MGCVRIFSCLVAEADMREVYLRRILITAPMHFVTTFVHIWWETWIASSRILMPNWRELFSLVQTAGHDTVFE